MLFLFERGDNVAETQLASMRIGSVDMLDEEREGKTGVAPLIHIADGQSDELIGDIAQEYIIDDTHRQSLEDTLETYEFYTFGDQSFTQHLKDRNRIIIPDEDGTLREFIIYESEKYRDTEGYKMYVIGTASYLDLKKANVIRPGSFTGTASQHIGIALNDTEWRPGIVEVSGAKTIHRDDFTNPFDYLKTLAREFEGELRFRIEHNGNRITGRFVDLLERIGEWRGREIEFGKDLDGIRRIENTERIVTALIGLGPEREDGTRLEVFVEDTEALQRWGRPDPVTGELRHLIEVYEPESDRSEMTEEELRQYTRTELNKRINAVVTYECSVVDLENVPGMENKQIRFGDTIRIKDTKFNPPLYIEARVYEIERSIKSKEKKDIKLGDYVEYTEEEVNAIWNQLRNEIRRRLDRMAIVTINSTAGNVFKNAQGETELTARTFVSGAERDEDGTLYDYQWMRFDKHGNHDTDFYAEGKTITVTANDIDEKATYRVLVAYELEVINTAEITISNVFDGEDGEPGPPGPKGEDGQGVENITIEYYLSDSDSTTTGGTWTETKPPYQPGKYLWIRQKITYKNPTVIEYTTPVLDDSWKAVEIADEAKQEAEEAKQEAQQAKTTADGKNSVFHSPTAPPTTGRKIGDVWFDTSRDNLMHRFNGVEWVEAKWGEQSIVANSITANHIKSLVGLNVNDQFVVDSQGNVKFSGDLEGASGTFSGDIEVQKIIDSQVFSNVFNGDEFRFVRFKKGITNPDTKNIDLSQIESLAKIFHDGVGFASSSEAMGIGLGGIFHTDTLNVNAGWIIINGNVYISSFNTPLWTGAVYLRDDHMIYPLKPLSECTTGWILQWQAYDPGVGIANSNYQYTHIPKTSLKNAGRGHRALLIRGSATYVNKYFYIYDTYITGVPENGQGDNRNLVLSAVYEY